MNSGETLAAKQEQVLRHIARYGLSFTEVVEHICFGGRSARKTIQALCDGNTPLTSKVGGFKGRRQALVLTEAGSRSIAGNAYRSKQPSHQRINLFAFCCLAGNRRIRLEAEEIKRFFGAPLPGRHLVMQCSGDYCLHSVCLPGASTKDVTILEKIESRLGELIECDESAWAPRPEDWLAAGRLRVTAIVETRQKAQRLNKALRNRLRNYDHPAVGYCSVAAARSNQLEELLGELRP